MGGTRRFVLLGFTLCCCSTPFLWSCPKKRGGAPKKGAWGGGAPVRFRDPPASPTRVGGATRPLRCPLRGRIESLAPGARGLGWQKSCQVKVFCPAFLQKSGRGPGAEPWPRAAARGTLLCSQSAGGGQRGNPRRGFPLCGRPKPPAASRTAIAPVVNERRAGVEPRPYGGWMNVVELAVDEGKGRRGRRPLRGAARPSRVPRNLPCAGRGVENGENAAPRGGVLISFAGRRGRQPLQGWHGEQNAKT